MYDAVIQVKAPGQNRLKIPLSSSIVRIGGHFNGTKGETGIRVSGPRDVGAIPTSHHGGNRKGVSRDTDPVQHIYPCRRAGKTVQRRILGPRQAGIITSVVALRAAAVYDGVMRGKYNGRRGNMVSVRFPELGELKRLDSYCERTGKRLSDFIRTAVTEKLHRVDRAAGATAERGAGDDGRIACTN